MSGDYKKGGVGRYYDHYDSKGNKYGSDGNKEQSNTDQSYNRKYENQNNNNYRIRKKPRGYQSKTSDSMNSEGGKERLRCAVFEPGCQREAKYLCSRCGKPLCGNQFCAWIVEEDYMVTLATSDKPERPPDISNHETRAVYCLECVEYIFQPSFIKGLFDKKIRNLNRKMKLLRKRRKKE